MKIVSPLEIEETMKDYFTSKQIYKFDIISTVLSIVIFLAVFAVVCINTISIFWLIPISILIFIIVDIIFTSINLVIYNICIKKAEKNNGVDGLKRKIEVKIIEKDIQKKEYIDREVNRLCTNCNQKDKIYEALEGKQNYCYFHCTDYQTLCNRTIKEPLRIYEKCVREIDKYKKELADLDIEVSENFKAKVEDLKNTTIDSLKHMSDKETLVQKLKDVRQNCISGEKLHKVVGDLLSEVERTPSGYKARKIVKESLFICFDEYFILVDGQCLSKKEEEKLNKDLIETVKYMTSKVRELKMESTKVDIACLDTELQKLRNEGDNNVKGKR